MILSAVAVLLLGTNPYCEEAPSKGPSRSEGRPSRGRLHGGVRLVDSDSVQTLPKRHRERCLNYGVERLIRALERAAGKIEREHEGGAPLGVGNIARARGGPIPPYSSSHQAGRDVDLAFFQLDADRRHVLPRDFGHFDKDGRGPDDALFDDARNFTLVRALLEDRTIDVRWLFVSEPLKARVLAEGRRRKAPDSLLRRAAEVLHQPSDAPPHDDHFHLRIRCTDEERAGGCVD